MNKDLITHYFELVNYPQMYFDSLRLSTGGIMDMELAYDTSIGREGDLDVVYDKSNEAKALRRSVTGDDGHLMYEANRFLCNLTTVRGRANVLVKQLPKKLRKRIYDLGMDMMESEHYYIAAALLSDWASAAVTYNEDHWIFSEGDVQVSFKGLIYVIYKNRSICFGTMHYGKIVPFVVGLLVAQGSITDPDYHSSYGDVDWDAVEPDAWEADKEHEPVDIEFNPSDFVGLTEEEIMKLVNEASGSKSTDSEDASAPTSLF